MTDQRPIEEQVAALQVHVTALRALVSAMLIATVDRDPGLVGDVIEIVRIVPTGDNIAVLDPFLEEVQIVLNDIADELSGRLDRKR